MSSKGYGSLSIGYVATKKRPGYGDVKRHLEEIDLSEVSVVLYPAAPRAAIEGAKSAEAMLTDLLADVRAHGAKMRAENHRREMARLEAQTKRFAELAERIRRRAA